MSSGPYAGGGGGGGGGGSQGPLMGEEVHLWVNGFAYRSLNYDWGVCSIYIQHTLCT